jgi:hypothetical protein
MNIMLPKLGKLLENWLLLPHKYGLLFWIGGFVAWIWRCGWSYFWEWFQKLTNEYIILLLLGVILVIASSANMLKRFDLFILRLLEGYNWPYWLKMWLIKKKEKWYFSKKENRLKKLSEKFYKNLQKMTIKEREEYAKLDSIFMYLPDLEERMPTKLGNILRTSEIYPVDRYGLDIFVCFPRLWFVLPREVKNDIVKAREDLDNSALIWIWHFLFMIWGIFTLWAIPLGFILMVLGYRWALQAAEIYAVLIEASFDLYRPLLYQELRWPLPTNPEEEKEKGEELTTYLCRGFSPSKLDFVSIDLKDTKSNDKIR